MASRLMAYSGIVTKARAMRASLLGRDELLGLAEYESVEDLISFLRESRGYGEVYRSHEEIAHRAQVETVIHDSLYSDYGRLYLFATGDQRTALSVRFLRYEVRVLKAIYQNALKGGGGFEQPPYGVFFEQHSDLDLEALTRAESVAEMAAALSGTKYGPFFERLAEGSAMDGADGAAQIDVLYYKLAWKLIDRIHDRQTREISRHILGTRIDLQNIMWAYRQLRFFGRSGTNVYADMIPIGYRLRRGEIEELSGASSLDEFSRILSGTRYKPLANREGGRAGESQTAADERSFRRALDAAYRDVCARHPMSIAPVLAYLYDKETEIEELTTILEGVRYRLPPRDIVELVTN